jgi:multicomponent Na+:H+ antiporter subunit G
VIVLDIASWVLILTGSGFILAGALGILRFPDVFTRAHAASVIETVGAGSLFAGLMLQAGFTQATLKLIFILLLFFFTGPVITHALAQAAVHAGLKPELDDDRRDRRSTNRTATPTRPDGGRQP